MAFASSSRIVQVTAEHVALLRRMQVVWIPMEAGAPYISLDSPYGADTKASDALSILIAAGFKDALKMNSEDAEKLHEEALR